MSRYTQTKLNRIFENTTLGIRREYPIPAEKREKKNCPQCLLDMFVSQGQHMRTHRACKADYKLRLKYVR